MPGTQPPNPDGLIAEIHSAFARVSREGGVSWSETDVLDGFGDPAARKEARAQDTDTDWRQLIDDAAFRPFPGTGGFSFIDPIGFRYYLPVTMVRFARGCTDPCDHEWFPGHLMGDIERFSNMDPQLFDKAQRKCISHFIQFMSVVDMQYGEDYAAAWQKALDGGWSRYLAPS